MSSRYRTDIRLNILPEKVGGTPVSPIEEAHGLFRETIQVRTTGTTLWYRDANLNGSNVYTFIDVKTARFTKVTPAKALILVNFKLKSFKGKDNHVLVFACADDIISVNVDSGHALSSTSVFQPDRRNAQ
jgi:hypothetical protein